jgi:TonB-linked SusC/RagA family outer membrane protein
MPNSFFALSDATKESILGVYNKNLDQNVGNQFTFNLNLGYTFSKHLKFTSQSSYLYRTSRRDYNRPHELTGNGNYSYTYSENAINLLSSNYLSYVRDFSKHSVSAIVGQDIQYDQFQNTQAIGSGGASDQIQVVQGFQQRTLHAYSDYQAYGLLSYYARVAYDFDGKYLLSASARTDGSSRFGKNNKWGFFPSASVAWIVSDEKFLQPVRHLTLLKLRASVGTSGSLPRFNYLQYNLYNVNNGGFDGNGGATSYNGVTAVTPNFFDGAAQKGLSWQKSMQWNVGTDIEIDNGKISASIDVYNRENTLQLFSVELPATSGYDVALTNSVGVRNSGVELTLAAYPLPAKSAVKWNTKLNIAYNKNRIMSLPNGGRDLVISGDRFDKSHILSVGQPVNSFYLYRTLGVYATDDDVPGNRYTGDKFRNGNYTYRAGDFIFADLDGDYFIDIFNDGINPDKLPIGDPNPRITGGWVNNITWKNLTLGVFCTFTFKRDVLNLFRSDQFNNSTNANGVANFAYYATPDFSKYDIWEKPGDQAEYAKYDIGTYGYYYTSAQTFFLEKGGYFRIKSISLSYELPVKKIRKFKLDRLRIYGVMDNVAIFQQSNRLPDAEAVNPYGEYNGGGYPIPKKYTLGVDIYF